MALTEDTLLIEHALAYVAELYNELTGENAAPTLGTQNQAVEYILGRPELREAVERWASGIETEEATTAPPRRLPRDGLYRAVRAFLEAAREPAPFAPP